MPQPVDVVPPEPSFASSRRVPDPPRPRQAPATPIAAEVLGAELAASVIARTLRMHDAAESVSAPMRLDVERVQTELGYLAVFTMHFCVDQVLGADPGCPRVLQAFYTALWSEKHWGPSRRGAERRVRRYGDAFNNPHPEYGRGYWTGRVFARLCGASHELAVIECGARAYVTQLPPILEFLRGISVV
jgi:hypothetical protein